MKAGTTDSEYVNIIVEEGVSSKNPVILEGFPGIGLVGNIVATQIASGAQDEAYRNHRISPVSADYGAL